MAGGVRGTSNGLFTYQGGKRFLKGCIMEILLGVPTTGRAVVLLHRDFRVKPKKQEKVNWKEEGF